MPKCDFVKIFSDFVATKSEKRMLNCDVHKKAWEWAKKKRPISFRFHPKTEREKPIFF